MNHTDADEVNAAVAVLREARAAISQAKTPLAVRRHRFRLLSRIDSLIGPRVVGAAMLRVRMAVRSEIDERLAALMRRRPRQS